MKRKPHIILYLINKMELLQSQAPAEGFLRGVECSIARNMEYRARSKDQGAQSKVQGARSKEYGVRNEQ